LFFKITFIILTNIIDVLYIYSNPNRAFVIDANHQCRQQFFSMGHFGNYTYRCRIWSGNIVYDDANSSGGTQQWFVVEGEIRQTDGVSVDLG